MFSVSHFPGGLVPGKICVSFHQGTTEEQAKAIIDKIGCCKLTSFMEELAIANVDVPVRQETAICVYLSTNLSVRSAERVMMHVPMKKY